MNVCIIITPFGLRGNKNDYLKLMMATIFTSFSLFFSASTQTMGNSKPSKTKQQITESKKKGEWYYLKSPTSQSHPPQPLIAIDYDTFFIPEARNTAIDGISIYCISQNKWKKVIKFKKVLSRMYSQNLNNDCTYDAKNRII